MVDVEHPVPIRLHGNIRRAVVFVFRSWRGKRNARFRNKAQQRLRVSTETALRNLVPGPLRPWAAKAACWDSASRRYKRRVGPPGNRNENGYRGARGGINQATEIASNFGRCRNGDGTLSLSKAILIYAEEPESFISPVIDFGQHYRSAERKSPVGFVVRVGCVQNPLIVRIYIIESAWSIEIGISVKEKSIAVNRVGPRFGVILLDALPQTVLRGKRTRQYVHVFDRVVRRLVPSRKARGF